MVELDLDDLFAKTLLGDDDDDAPWQAVHSLRRIGTREVFDHAARWIESAEPLKRARGLDVVAQLGKTAEHPSNSFPQESYDLVVTALDKEREFLPLRSAIAALGHLDDARAIPLVAAFSTDPRHEIRFSVACALGSFPNDPLSVKTLATLMEDVDGEVRDWATFGVGVLGDQDSVELRESFYRRLNDSDLAASEEAVVSLAKRHDLHVLPKLIELLSQTTVSSRAVEAACMLLGMSNDREEWSGQDYANALRQQFGL
jgi:HEAT repeat protein